MSKSISRRKADFHIAYQCGLKGDVNGSGSVDLKDAIIALQIVTGGQPSVSPCLEASVNGSSGIGLPEAIFAMGRSAGL